MIVMEVNVTIIVGELTMADKEYIERDLVLSMSVDRPMCDIFGDMLGFESIVRVDDINKIPSADAVEVVKCKDCSYCDPENKHCDHPMGTSLPIPRKDNDFCSYGERKIDDV